MPKTIAVQETKGLIGSYFTPSEEPLIRAVSLAIPTPTIASVRQVQHDLCSDCLASNGSRRLGVLVEGEDMSTIQVCHPRTRVWGKRNCIQGE